MNILEIENLSKKYGSRHALDNVSFSLPRGSVCGLLGPNGAGKTTLLRIINSILDYDSGRVFINGQPASRELGSEIGYMPEERGLYDKMRVEDQIMYFGLLKGGEKERLSNTMDEYLELFNLSGERKRRIKELSKGNQQKVQIIATIVHEPELVILDEPFSGFDPINGVLLHQLINRLRQRGATVILSSHNMASVEEICTDITLINCGKLLLSGRIDDIKEANRRDELFVTLRRPLQLETMTDSGLVESAEPTETSGWRKGYSYRIVKNSGVSNNEFLAKVAQYSEIIHFEEALPSLKDIFLRYTSENQNV